MINEILGEKNMLGKHYLSMGIGLLVLLYIVTSIHYCINFPVNADDVIICLTDLQRYLDGEISLIDYIFLKKNRNPTIVLRIINYLVYAFSGKVNFALVPIIANILYAFFVFTLSYKSRFLKFFWIIPILLFIPSTDFINWSSAVASYAFPAIFLFIFLERIPNIKTRLEMLWLLPMITLMTYSFANGFIACLVLIVYCLYLLWLKKADLFTVTSIVAICILNIIVFLSGFEGQNNLSFSWQKFEFALAFCSNYIKYISTSENIYLAMLVTALLSSNTIYILIRNYRDIFVIKRAFIIGFIGATAIVVALGRCGSPILCNPFFERYEIFGLIFLVFNLMLILKFNHKYLQYAFLAFILIVSFFRIKENLYELNYEKYLRTRQASVGYLTDNYSIRAYSDEMRDICRENYSKSVNEGLTLPLSGITLEMTQIKGNKDDFRELDFKFSRLINTEAFSLLRGWKLKGGKVPMIVWHNNYPYKVKPTFNPKNQSEFFVILPRTTKSKIKISTYK
ncbi:MAG: hypothetical protein HKN51_06125 [Saprospiraceae bacterium]|nr:hypothetical protein [Saprospiraceae bacterium]